MTGIRTVVAGLIERRPLDGFAANAASVLSSEVVARASSFVIYAVVGSRLGSFELGQLSLALSLVYLFQILASAGQRTLMIRELAREPAGIVRQLRAVTGVVIMGCLAALVPLALLILAFRWESSTVSVILVVFLGLFPFALSQTIEGMMQGLEQMRFIALANVPLHLLKAGVAAALILNGAGVAAAAAVVAATYWLVLLVELALLWRHLVPADVDRSRARPRENLRRGSGFLGVEVVYAIGSALPILIVSALLGEESVGVLSAAQQAVVPLSLATNSLIAVTFPAMCRVFDRAVGQIRLIVVNLIEAVLMLIVPFITIVSVFALYVINTMYRNDELDGAASLMQILVWWSVINVVATVLGQTLWAQDRELTSMVIGIWSAGATLVAHVVLVPLFGLDGVPPAMAVVAVVILVQHYRPLADALSVRSLLLAVWRPAAAVVVQVGFLLLARNLAVVPAALLSLVVYAAALAMIVRLPIGGSRRPQPLTPLLENLTARTPEAQGPSA